MCARAPTLSTSSRRCTSGPVNAIARDGGPGAWVRLRWPECYRRILRTRPTPAPAASPASPPMPAEGKPSSTRPNGAVGGNVNNPIVSPATAPAAPVQVAPTTAHRPRRGKCPSFIRMALTHSSSHEARRAQYRLSDPRSACVSGGGLPAAPIDGHALEDDVSSPLLQPPCHRAHVVLCQ